MTTKYAWSLGSRSSGKPVITDQARHWLTSALTNPTVAQQFREELRVLGHDCGIESPGQVTWIPILVNRDKVMQGNLWPRLSDDCKAFVILTDDEDIDHIVATTVDRLMACYVEEFGPEYEEIP